MDERVNNQGFEQRVGVYRQRIEDYLSQTLDSIASAPAGLSDAMAYATLGGGKRVRPLMCYASAEVLGLEAAQVDPIAAAIEMIHCFSLVHDDLPAMDDDALRRGRPTAHIAFGEATAILAGDALQSLAFETLANAAPAPHGAVLVAALAHATGAQGMTGGQALDLSLVGQQPDAATLDQLHRLKTGALLQACVTMPCRLAVALGRGPGPEDRQRLLGFADAIGLAFQIHDDVLDETASTEALGKPRGSDRDAGKATWVTVLGLEAARRHADEVYQQALTELNGIAGEREPLAWMARYILRRDH